MIKPSVFHFLWNALGFCVYSYKIIKEEIVCPNKFSFNKK